MTSEFSQAFDSETETLYGTCQHLLETASAIGFAPDAAFGLSADMSTEQLESVAAAIQAEIAAEAQRRRLAEMPVCNIGPYDGQFCTICGGRQP